MQEKSVFQHAQNHVFLLENLHKRWDVIKVNKCVHVRFCTQSPNMTNKKCTKLVLNQAFANDQNHISTLRKSENSFNTSASTAAFMRTFLTRMMWWQRYGSKFRSLQPPKAQRGRKFYRKLTSLSSLLSFCTTTTSFLWTFGFNFNQMRSFRHWKPPVKYALRMSPAAQLTASEVWGQQINT